VAPLRACVVRAAEIACETVMAEAAWLKEASRHDHIQTEQRLRSGWAIVAITLLEMIRTSSEPDVRRALDWFGVADDAADWRPLQAALAPLHGRPELADLLPYLLDTYGRTSRLDVIRDASLGGSRAARKEAGSFYTPGDVADFMVRAIASEPSDPEFADEWWLDPACGSGVFLLAALRDRFSKDPEGAVEFATGRLAGCDISPQACDFAAFAILGFIADSIDDPVDRWRSIRRNLVALDATKRGQGPAALNLRELAAPSDSPLRLICNPPYVSFSSEKATLLDGYPTRALYLPFVEMAWHVAHRPRDSAALVVPLALGANRSTDHRRCRNGMARAGGDWTLLFFDRQPHALFGEDAKTRATIAIRRPGPVPAAFRTSGLLKWTSRQRGSILNEDRAVDLGQVGIGRLVPKLSSSSQVDIYKSLEIFRLRSGVRPEPSKAAADDIVGNKLSADVFVAGTAYNFLNVFRNYPDHLSWRGTLSASSIHRLQCATMAEADAVTAIMASRLAFWLWHVECDGFHVPAWFLAELPLLNIRLDARDAASLAGLGREIWAGLQKDVLCSVNRERLTFAFRPTAIADLREEVDRVLLGAVGIDPFEAAALADFERKVVSIDGSVRLTRPRDHLGKVA
jgi:hypothetical protein